jgi:hypothetical protein
MNVTGASLTVALEEPGSAINQFFDQVLPLDGPLRERWASELRRLRAQRGSVVSAVTSHLDGMAIELRIASDLAPPPKISLLGAAGTTLGTIFLEHLASVPEEHPSLEKIVRLGFDFGDRSDDEVLRFCRRLGNFLDIYRILRKHQPCPTGEQIAAWWELLVDSNVPEANLDSLRDVWRRYLRYGRPELEALGERVLISPEFARGFGVGDMILGKTLVDIKLSQQAEDHQARWLRQIVGYALADHDDSYGIERVASTMQQKHP